MTVVRLCRNVKLRVAAAPYWITEEFDSASSRSPQNGSTPPVYHKRRCRSDARISTLPTVDQMTAIGKIGSYSVFASPAAVPSRPRRPRSTGGQCLASPYPRPLHFASHLSALRCDLHCKHLEKCFVIDTSSTLWHSPVIRGYSWRLTGNSGRCWHLDLPLGHGFCTLVHHRELFVRWWWGVLLVLNPFLTVTRFWQIYWPFPLSNSERALN